jgi:hypothetical protein
MGDTARATRRLSRSRTAGCAIAAALLCPFGITACHKTKRRRRRAGPVLAALALVALLVAACGSGSKGPGVARVGSSTPAASGSSSAGTGKSAVAYARCMRSHGVPNFPDPDSHGRFHHLPDINSPQSQAAQNACKDLLPSGGGQWTGGGGNLSPQQQAQLLKFAQCMRAHGIKNFPDPTSQGLEPGNGIDPNSPQFKAAQQACHSLLPNTGNGQQSQNGHGS